jgi:hypothetical protein
MPEKKRRKSMKKTGIGAAAAMAEPMTGCYGGVDIGALYIDMLCEKFKNRGIRTGIPAEKSADVLKKAKSFGIEVEEISGDDKKYKTLMIDGRAYMSSDDFAAYYKDTRGYKLPHFYSRADKEYEEAATVKNVQESGKPSKKALWLAIKGRTERCLRGFVKGYIVDEARKQIEEEVIEGKKKRIPRSVFPTLAVVTMSLLLVVCSSVMVSRASSDVSKLEYKLEVLQESKNDLEGKLVEKNDMLDIQRIAVEDYQMITRGYVKSKYLDVTEKEKIEIFDGKSGEDSFIVMLLKAIGIIPD